MEKTITIGDKQVRLNNNVGWLFVYRDQFGHDIVPALMPILASIFDLLSGVVGENNEISMDTIKNVAESDRYVDALAHLSGIELVELINITWALAKCADKTIPEPEEWVKDFDSFPVDEIAPQIFSIASKGLVSSKNLERLRITKTEESPEPLTLTQSSSQDSSED